MLKLLSSSNFCLLLFLLLSFPPSTHLCIRQLTYLHPLRTPTSVFSLFLTSLTYTCVCLLTHPLLSDFLSSQKQLFCNAQPSSLDAEPADVFEPHGSATVTPTVKMAATRSNVSHGRQLSANREHFDVEMALVWHWIRSVTAPPTVRTAVMKTPTLPASPILHLAERMAFPVSICVSRPLPVITVPVGEAIASPSMAGAVLILMSAKLEVTPTRIRSTLVIRIILIIKLTISTRKVTVFRRALSSAPILSRASGVRALPVIGCMRISDSVKRSQIRNQFLYSILVITLGK